MAGTFRLTIKAGPEAGKAIAFDSHDTLLIGRIDDCQICLPDDNCVSRHHFLLEVNPPDARLRDLGSYNGTIVNGQKYGGRTKEETPEQGARCQHPQVDLYDGDEIKVGKTILQVSILAATLPAGSVRCQRCGSAAPGENGSGREGAFLCQSCCNRIEAAPAQELLPLLQHEQPRTPAVEVSLDYQIIRELGKGGMGAVYLAQHRKTGQQVALKVMLPRVAVDKQARDRFLREFEVTRTLRHPHLVEVLGGGVQGSIFYFLLEFCEGGDVARLMTRRGGSLPLQEAGPLMLQALEGLIYMHAQGVVHRDLKPLNVLLKGREGSWSVKVADLGLAKNFEQAGLSGMTATGTCVGSFPFMPREQMINFRFVKPISDIWAMGATCYNMLTGSYPRAQRVGQDPIEVILHGEVVPIRQRNPLLPEQVARVIDRSLATRISERYQSADEMYDALRDALQ